jgi:hypothetical protein
MIRLLYPISKNGIRILAILDFYVLLRGYGQFRSSSGSQIPHINDRYCSRGSNIPFASKGQSEVSSGTLHTSFYGRTPLVWCSWPLDLPRDLVSIMLKVPDLRGQRQRGQYLAAGTFNAVYYWYDTLNELTSYGSCITHPRFGYWSEFESDPTCKLCQNLFIFFYYPIPRLPVILPRNILQTLVASTLIYLSYNHVERH